MRANHRWKVSTKANVGLIMNNIRKVWIFSEIRYETTDGERKLPDWKLHALQPRDIIIFYQEYTKKWKAIRLVMKKETAEQNEKDALDDGQVRYDDEDIYPEDTGTSR